MRADIFTARNANKEGSPLLLNPEISFSCKLHLKVNEEGEAGAGLLHVAAVSSLSWEGHVNNFKALISNLVSNPAREVAEPSVRENASLRESYSVLVRALQGNSAAPWRFPFKGSVCSPSLQEPYPGQRPACPLKSFPTFLSKSQFPILHFCTI